MDAFQEQVVDTHPSTGGTYESQTSALKVYLDNDQSVAIGFKIVGPTIPEFRVAGRGLVQGVKQMLDRKVLHRDLNPANVLIHGSDARITDYGLAYRFRPDNSRFAAVTR
ncbi:hypothetical protein BGX29_000647 [Mortierella sp. GBA35]|nr:hypothetical protein BGX29_000647 [Mortierella sp. GBA35]